MASFRLVRVNCKRDNKLYQSFNGIIGSSNNPSNINPNLFNKLWLHLVLIELRYIQNASDNHMYSTTGNFQKPNCIKIVLKICLFIVFWTQFVKDIKVELINKQHFRINYNVDNNIILTFVNYLLEIPH